MPVYKLSNDIIFPHSKYAEPDGLLAIGGDLSVNRLLCAYENGIFPWFSEGDPILWWAPNPRFIITPESFKVSKSLKRIVNSNKFEIRIDTCFLDVIRNCQTVSRKGEDGTWITDSIVEAYFNLHKLGYAHSFEVFFDDELVGGLYGISIGKSFFGESMFHKTSNASKVALYFLVEKMKEFNFDFIDVQMKTNHLLSLGAFSISLDEYLRILDKSLDYDSLIGKWKM